MKDFPFSVNNIPNFSNETGARLPVPTELLVLDESPVGFDVSNTK